MIALYLLANTLSRHLHKIPCSIPKRQPLAKENRYVIRVKGDSTAPRIQDSDLILVDYIKEPRPGNIVVATVNGGVVVKKYLLQGERVVFKSMNPEYVDIEVKETDQLVIAGVALRIVEGAL